MLLLAMLPHVDLSTSCPYRSAEKQVYDFENLLARLTSCVSFTVSLLF